MRSASWTTPEDGRSEGFVRFDLHCAPDCRAKQDSDHVGAVHDKVRSFVDLLDNRPRGGREMTGRGTTAVLRSLLLDSGADLGIVDN
ncbi:hypothetical protein DL766_009496 [Monosporascus sp. MC13-8B]|uniref:Peptidase A2 domain-containing protein n=1 Tax=Monosporascus cannonballus TaxID=155416 RepID=A0ABY0GZU4_9PEZI|nr:hypothetical protein DL762_007218 [Monosporascus cannonballus]RYO88647.1 hypothetical protein DL763_005921 [Monosporascus cannonballus]RYP15127.1 hypothetical protein DL766_009496 [Monosporascus sp. MC13-8B]